MIALTSSQGHWLKTLPSSEEAYTFHRQFGFITEKKLAERIRRRTMHGLRAVKSAEDVRFKLVKNAAQAIEPQAVSGCEFTKVNHDWQMKTAFGEFKLVDLDQIAVPAIPARKDEEGQRLWKYALLALLFFGGSLLLFPKSDEVAPPPVLEPVKVTIIPEVQKQVVVPATKTLTDTIVKDAKIVDKKVQRSIQQNLGFLGLLGKKNLTKAMGGMPSQIKDASPGAGAGGKEGSGGEYLVGLGQGVKRATVGNTGVAGLGGIGTKGAGGGAGGYGNTMIGSGEGRSLSKVALAQEMELEGGLDRAVIQATIAKYLSQVRACYEEQLQGNPGLAGQVTMNFVIGGAGQVTTAQVGRTTLGNAATEGCIAARMKTWMFPKPVGGVNVKVNYPFLLRPAGT